MSVISDAMAKVEAHYAQIGSDVDAIAAAITVLNGNITALQNSAGTVTPADQALIDSTEAQGAAVQAKVDALATSLAAPATPAS